MLTSDPAGVTAWRELRALIDSAEPDKRAQLLSLERDTFEPAWSDVDRSRRMSAWHEAVSCARGRN